MMDSSLLAYHIIINEIKANGNVTIRIVGKSMFPTLFDGDCIKIIEVDQYYPGDIIVFISNSKKIVVHRVIESQNNLYLTKGDNNDFFDDVITKDAIIGKVISCTDSSNLDFTFADNHWIILCILYLSKREALKKCGYLSRGIKRLLLKISKRRITKITTM